MTFVREVLSLMEGDGLMVMLQRLLLLWEGECSRYRSARLNGGGRFKGGRMVVTEVVRGRILQKWSV